MIVWQPYRTRNLCLTLMTMVMLGMTGITFAQSVVNNTNVYIPEDLTVHIDGYVDNTGFIQNLGVVYFTGDWRNVSVYQGDGTLVISGNGPQTIGNNKQAVHTLVVDGTGDKVIHDLFPITGQLQMLSGIVFVSEDDTLLLQSTATVTGGSPQSYVSGALYSEGVGYKYFPIGKNGLFNPVELTDVTGINPNFSLEAHPLGFVVNAPEGITPYRDVYWKRTDVSGTYTSSPVVLGYDIADNRTDTHQIEILESDELTGTFTALGKVSVEYGNALDKVVSEDGELTRKVFLAGESIPIGGVEGVFYISTSLSPHAANESNRTIRIFGNELEADGFQFVVYNRWGLIVYETGSLQDMLAKGWDGKKGWEALPAGAYPYVLKAKMKNGQKLEKKGVISVVN